MEYHTTAWDQIDAGLEDLMANVGQRSKKELVTELKRLRHLSLFVKTLGRRIEEEISEGKACDSASLFTKYYEDRNQIDLINN